MGQEVSDFLTLEDVPKRRYGIIIVRRVTSRFQDDCLFQVYGRNVLVVQQIRVRRNYGRAMAEKCFIAFCKGAR
jgi:hypothetical protein